MKLSFIREKLLTALNVALKMVSTQVTLPILSNVMIESDKGRLKIAATDLEVGMETWIGAKIIKDGSITLPAKLLFELLNSISDEKITLEETDNKIKINTQTSKSILRGMPASDFPLIPHIKDPIGVFEIKSADLKNAVMRNLFSCAVDETRPVLTGILFKVTKEAFIFAATDSYRLSEAKILAKNKVSKDLEVIIPKRTMNELVRIIGENDEKVKIEIGENQIAFSIGDIYFISRLIEGSFPEYGQIIPQKFDTNVILDKSQLILKLKTASLFSRDSANNIKIHLDKTTKELIIYSYSQQLGENQSLLSIDKFDGKDLKFSINSQFLQDTLNAIKQEKVEIKALDSLSAIAIKPLTGNDYICIVMPLRQEE